MDLKEVHAGASRRHPWETARARHFLRLLERCGELHRARRILDVGAGDGFFARALVGHWPAAEMVVCFDALYSDHHLEELAGKDPDPRLRFVREEPSHRFDLLLLLDVIEHVPDDRTFVAGLVERRLAPGGALLVSVPAWQALYTRHDVALGHWRRYRPAELRRVLEASGLEVLVDGNLFHSLILVRAFQKLGELAAGQRSRPNDPEFGRVDEKIGVGGWNRGDVLTRLVDRALAADNVLGRALAAGRWRLPGLSTWALCRQR